MKLQCQVSQSLFACNYSYFAGVVSLGNVENTLSGVIHCSAKSPVQETTTSVSAGRIILTPTQPVASGRPQRGSNSGPPHQESRPLPTELPPPPPPPPPGIAVPHCYWGRELFCSLCYARCHRKEGKKLGKPLQLTCGLVGWLVGWLVV